MGRWNSATPTTTSGRSSPRRTGAVGDIRPQARALLTSVYRGTQSTLETGTRIENKQHLSLLLDSPVARRLVRTDFYGVRALRKQTARPERPHTDLHRVGVVGAGLMGSGITAVSLAAGLDVVLVDIDQRQLDTARDRLDARLRREVDRGRITEPVRADRLRRLTCSTDVAGVAGAGLVIEAVTESRSIKEKVLADIASAAPAAVIATNTSSLPVGSLAHAVSVPDRFIGLHFVSPVAPRRSWSSTPPGRPDSVPARSKCWTRSP